MMGCTRNSILSLLFLTGILLSSCYQPREGCLDINATNFDATADENCCCLYPALQLKFQQFAGGEVFKLKDTLSNDFGQQFTISSVSCYFSGFEFTGVSGNVITVKDTIQLPAISDSIVLKKDVSLVRANTSNVVLGRLIQEESIDKVSFQIGVPDEANAAIISKIPSSSELSVQIDSLYDALNGYVSLRYVFTTGIESGSTERFIRIFDNLPLNFDFQLPIKRAFNTCLTIVIDHAFVLHNVDVKNDSDEMVKAKILQNLPSALVLIQCD